MKADHDIIIAGGGIVGLTAACALAQAGFNVALVDPRKETDFSKQDILDARVSAVTVASKHIFENIGVWQSLPVGRRTALQAMHVWDAHNANRIDFDAADIGQPNLGYIVANNDLMRALFVCLRKKNKIKFYPECSITSFSDNEECVSVQLSSRSRVTTALLIGADGANSVVRKHANININYGDYGQCSITTLVECGREHYNAAWQRFNNGEVLALLPFEGNHCAVVWSVAENIARSLCALSDVEFLASLQDTFGDHLGRLQQAGPRQSFPLSRLHAKNYVTRRLVLIGDAAHRVHPLAGQGINMGLMDVAVLTQLLASMRDKDKTADPGDWFLLRRYERQRKAGNLAMLGATDGLWRLFGVQNTLFAQLRHLGIWTVNRLPIVKNQLMREACGLRGQIPALARGSE